METEAAHIDWETLRLDELGIAELSQLMVRDEDRVPRVVIDECVRRGEAMVEHLASLLESAHFWSDDASRGEWWMRLHAAMILGLIPGERSGALLVALMRRAGEVDDDNLQEWLCTHWPALFRNKPHGMVCELRTIAENRPYGWYLRSCALDSALYLDQLAGEQALEEGLAWSARIAGDETEDWEMRVCTGNRLLDFPRDAYRPLLEKLGARQKGFGAFFTKEDVAEAYAARTDKPEWERRRDPWEFYDPQAIQNRQERWAKEDAERAAREADADREVDHDEEDHGFMIPYVRETPKVGRNDPCPCGSGKKYKKCCLRPE